jgi:hypothetical protein
VPAGRVVGSDTPSAGAVQCSVSCVGTTDRTQCRLQFSLGTLVLEAYSVSEGFERLVMFVERAVSRVARRKSGAREKMYSAAVVQDLSVRCVRVGEGFGSAGARGWNEESRDKRRGILVPSAQWRGS